MKMGCFILVLALCGCATSFTPIGQNLYSMSKTSAACGFRSAGGVKNALYEKAATFCAKQNRFPEIVTVQERDGVIGSRCASADIEFRCVDARPDAYQASGQKPDRDLSH